MPRQPEDIEDELLILRCQVGEGEALRDLVVRWHSRLRRLATRLTANPDVASDLTQDAWLAIVRGLRGLDDPAQFRVWAYRIVANRCADWIRRRQVRREAARDVHAATAARNQNAQSMQDSAQELNPLDTALRRLPDDQRAMLSLHHLDGLSVSQIAVVFDLPVGTVKSRLHSARARLKSAILEIDHERAG